MKKILFLIFTKSLGLYINALSFVFPKKASQLAYDLFSKPRKGKLFKNKLPQILLAAKSEVFQVEDDFFYTYTWQGNRNTILLIHGWESNASRWETLLPYLQKTGNTIVAIDAPAHGLSSGKEFNIPKYAAFIDVVVQKLKPQHLIGHSIGGKTCLYYQSTYQNTTLKKIVILGSPSDFQIIINNYINLLGLNTRILKALETYYLTHFKTSIQEFSGQVFASKLNIEGFIAHDIQDDIVLFEEGKKIESTWKKAVFIETTGVGHSMHDDELYKKITHFLLD